MKLLCLTLAALSAVAWSAPPADAQVILPPIVIPICGVTVNCATIEIAYPGDGSGRVTSDRAGIDCTYTRGVQSGSCSRELNWPLATQTWFVTVDIRAEADSHVFDRDDGSRSAGVTSTFGLAPGSTGRLSFHRIELNSYAVAVTVGGLGQGRVTSSYGAIECPGSTGGQCSQPLRHHAQTTLQAQPSPGSVFEGWTGACAGNGASCALTITGPVETQAVFGPAVSAPSPVPIPAPVPGPSPSPSPSPRPTPPVPAPPPNGAVEADVIGHKLGRSALGFRLVRVELELDERVAATVRLMRGKKTLLTKHVAALGLGRRVVTLVVPNRIAKGTARVVLGLRDADGNTRSWSRSVVIARSGK